MRGWLTRLVTVATRYPRAAVACVAVFVVAGALVAALGPLEVSTSRRALMSDDDPVQARLIRFFEDFGRPDSAVFVIEGGEERDRRQVARKLIEKIRAVPELADRVLGRVDLALVAEVLALHRPSMVDGLRLIAGEDGRQTAGFDTLFAAMEARILDAIDGVEEGEDEDGAVAGTSEDDLAKLAPFIGAFEAWLVGDESGGALIALAADTALDAQQHVDDAGYLIGAKGGHHLVATFPRLTNDEGRDVKPLVETLRGIRDGVLADVGAPGVTAELTGLPALSVDELNIISHGMRITTVLTVLGILLLLYLAFRSLRQSLLALVPLAAGVIITLGIVELMYDGLNLVTSGFLSVLMGLGIDLGVHLLYRYGEERRGGGDQQQAMRGALLHASPGVTTGAATTALAFLTTTTTDFTAFGELGVIMTVGLATMLVCAFLLIPPLMRLSAADQKPPSPMFPGARVAMTMVRGWPRWVLGAAAVVTVGAVVGLLPSGPSYDGRYFDLLPHDTESYRGLLAVERDGEMGPGIVNSVVDGLDEARTLSARLRAVPEVARVHSPTDLLPVLDEALIGELTSAVAGLPDGLLARLVAPVTPVNAAGLAKRALALQDAFDELAHALRTSGRQAAPAEDVSKALASLRRTLKTLGPVGDVRLAEIERDAVSVARRALTTATQVAKRKAYAPGDLPPLFRERFVSDDGQKLAVYSYPAGDVWTPPFSGAFSSAVLQVDPQACGIALDSLRHQDLIVEGFIRAALYAAILVLFGLLLVYRRVSDALLAMFPVVVGWVWMLGSMKPLGLTFNVANIVALPLLLGIGLDSGAHMIHRYRESLANGGHSASLTDLVGGTGAAVLVSSLTTMVGFAALMAGEYGGMTSLGLLLVVGIGFTLLTSVLVLPALLVLLGRAR